jgi:ribosomal protein L16 Arg81 hydroxylase
MSWATTDPLELLLRPLEPAVFLAEHWARRPAVLRDARERWAGLFDEDALLRCIERQGQARAASRTRDDAHVERVIRPGEARASLAAGETLCASAIDGFDERLASFLARLGTRIAFPGPLLFNCYLSPDGAGFGTHLDNHSVFILQLEGAKRWRYSAAPAVAFPTENLILPAHGAVPVPRPAEAVERPDERAFLEAVLEPGDVLYLPAGTWHRARAVGRSLALTLMVSPFRTQQLLSAALERALLDDPRLREDVPLVLAGDLPRGEATAALRDHLIARLDDLRRAVAALSPLDLCDAWYEAAVPPRHRVPPAQRPSIDPSARLRLHPGEPLVYFEADPGQIALYRGGKRYELPVAALPVLQRSAEAGVFPARLAVTWIATDVEWPEVQGLLEDLVEIGVLEVESSSQIGEESPHEEGREGREEQRQARDQPRDHQDAEP